MQRTETPAQRDRSRDLLAEAATDYARAQERRAWQSNRDEIHRGAATVPARYGR
ncbi:hypothetical protein [Streptomyces thermolilacinus]|uniref:hypothetical protein n=1 Tax=Streptomyces thermolilacinus TaxID=285540 RepID=UPI0033F45259